VLLTPATIPALLERHGLRPSRALGQHFLADPNTARRIVRLAEVAPGDAVLEIGPGIGSLTTALLEAGARVTAIEMDRHVLPALTEVVGDQVTVLVGDAMHIDLPAALGGAVPAREGTPAPWKLVANLPYNVATPIVMHVLETAPTVDSLLVMVQREVGERFAASPGTKAYGAVSVKAAYFGAVRVVGIVPPTVFVPPPKVDSALVRITRHAHPPVVVPDADALFALVRAGFGQRRKMLRGALRGVLGADAAALLAAAGIDERRRAETLTLEEWAGLARVAA
jgi:16S rRNA (adenine1518-N6/adenine1519-N6)-dimethyltransferase